jgi:CO dehydrogenase maturation factor
MNKTVSQIRRSIIEEPGTRAEVEARHIRDVMAEAVQSGPGFDLLVMGRPEGPGCYCSINDLLRYGIDSLSRDYDVTLIDCEAGPEQVNRRVVNGVDFLVIVTDTSSRGMHTATSIAKVVERDREMRVGQVGLVVNRAKGASEHVARIAQEKAFHIIGSVPEDPMVAEYDSLGRPLTGLPDTCASVIAVRDILTVLSL